MMQLRHFFLLLSMQTPVETRSRHEQVNQQEGEGAEKSHKLFPATNQSSIRASEFKFPPDLVHVNATLLLLNRYLAAEILI